MKYLLCVMCCSLGACSSLGFVNEDAGHSILASDVSVPANGTVVYTIARNPRTDHAARQYQKDNNVSRSLASWFGFGSGPELKSAGSTQSQIRRPNGS